MLAVALILSLVLMALSFYRYRKVFNPFSLEAYFTILFMIIPQLIVININDAESFFWSDVVIIVYLISIFLGTMVNTKVYRLKAINNVKVVNTLNIILYVLLILPILPIFLQYGLSATGFRAFYENVVFSKFASFYELSKLVLYFIIFFKLLHKQRFTMGFFILSPLVFLYGSRFVILDFIIFLSVFLEQYRTYTVKRIILIGTIGALVIAVYSANQFSRTKFELLFTSYFDIYKNQALVVNRLLENETEYYYGEIFFSSYLRYVPRILWPEKPKAFGFAILNYEYYPEEAKSGYMPGFGLGVAFADFGFFSVMLMGFVAGFIRNFFYRTFLKAKNNLTFFLYIFPFSLVTSFLLLLYLFLDHLISTQMRSKTAQP